MIKILDVNEIKESEILNRSIDDNPAVETAVKSIIANVKVGGDTAVRSYTLKYDGVTVTDMRVTEKEIDDAVNSLDKEFLDALTLSAKNISEFHKKQLRVGFEMKKADGVILGQRILPLSRVGIYVPGGTASYPSTVLMNAIPASIAGVRDIVMVTPPQKDGKIKAEILAAARLSGVTEIYKVGGAQAIAALALGTDTIRKVDKITGPGNVYVATAKKLVFGLVDIDMIAGPSEILIIADEFASADRVAADLLSQAEHDKNSSAVLVTNSKKLANSVARAVDVRLSKLARKDIATVSIDNNGKILLVKDIEQALFIANKIAPEHLELCVENPFELLPKVKNAGSVFLGAFTPEALGDYSAGPNHTLPTGGTAKFSSPLSVDAFIKKSSYIYYTEEALKKIADKVELFAEREGLTAHSESVKSRFEEEK